MYKEIICHFTRKRRRRETVFANTLFKCVVYNKDENQIITSGTDRKIAYWESDNAALIRELEGAKTEAVNAMDISVDGEYFVSGGDDKLLKVCCSSILAFSLVYQNICHL